MYPAIYIYCIVCLGCCGGVSNITAAGITDNRLLLILFVESCVLLCNNPVAA